MYQGAEDTEHSNLSINRKKVEAKIVPFSKYLRLEMTVAVAMGV